MNEWIDHNSMYTWTLPLPHPEDGSATMRKYLQVPIIINTTLRWNTAKRDDHYMMIYLRYGHPLLIIISVHTSAIDSLTTHW